MNLDNFPLLNFPSTINPLSAGFLFLLPDFCGIMQQTHLSRPLFALFYQVEIRHRQSYNDNPVPRSGYRMFVRYPTITAIEWLSISRCVRSGRGNDLE